MRPTEFPQPLDTLMVATCNVLNLANPGRLFYENQDPYSQTEFERKITWLGERFRALNADVLAVQEVWDDAAFKGALGRGGMRYDFVAVPGAENNDTQQGAQGTPRVGLATRLKVEAVQSFADFPPGFQVDVPGIGQHMRFERPPLVATLRMKHGQTLNVLTAHLKSKRPKFLQDALGQPTEDRDDRKVVALASLRSLIMRGAEAMALAARAGIPLDTMYDVVTNAAGNSWMFENRMKHVVDGDYTPTSAVDIFVKDLGLVTETGRALGFPLPLASTAFAMFQQASNMGHGREDDSAVIKTFSGITLPEGKA